MPDPTPPSDIPDPASPTPASPAPTSGPGPAAGAKRIRSMPDRPATLRPTGTIRSLPSQERTQSSYVTGVENERSWGRGLAILWALFLATLLLELLNAVFFVLAGKAGWPVPIEAGRLALVCTFFISLWTGWGWLRYLLATVDFLSGAWLLTDFVLSYRATPKFKAIGEADWTIYSSIETFPKIALGLLYLATAAYVLFSDDVREFVAHRRARGRVGSSLLAAIVSYGGMLLIFAAQPFYAHWMLGQRADAQRFGDETLRAMAEHWDPTALDALLDPPYAKTFTKADRVSTFTPFKSLGTLKSITPGPVVARTPMPQYPLQDKVPIPQDIHSEADAAGTGFEVTATYATTSVEFEHGRAPFGFDLVRDLFGLWRITKLNVASVQYDQPPRPAPTPGSTETPAPTGTAAPSSSPTIAPPPAATVTPAASPVPTTGQ